jgi:hypothetical protein
MSQTVYKGEVQLASWSDTSNGGAKIVLWLPDSEALDGFKALTERKGKTAGQILACMITTVDESDTQREPHETVALLKGEPVLKGGPLSKAAAMLTQNPVFQDWVMERLETFSVDKLVADQYIKDTCLVVSKREFDNNEKAASRFHNLIRKPFVEWQENTKCT